MVRSIGQQLFSQTRPIAFSTLWPKCLVPRWSSELGLPPGLAHCPICSLCELGQGLLALGPTSFFGPLPQRSQAQGWASQDPTEWLVD